MKTTVLLLFAAFSICRAEDWTVDGKTYHNVIVGRVEPDCVHITYDGGLGSVPLADLSPELRKRFGYDPAQAKAASQQKALAQERAAQSYAEADKESATYQADLARETAQESVSQQNNPWTPHQARIVTGPAANPRGMHASGVAVPGLYVQVLQVLPNGILAEPWSYPTDGRYIDFSQGVGAYVPTGKTIFIQCNSSGLAQDEMYSANATRDGTFAYQDVTGASRTVEKFVVTGS